MSGPPTSGLTGWEPTFTVGGYTHDCYEKGDGPGVVLLPELPGITPEVLGLGDHLVTEGFTVVIPSLFGEPGRPASLARTAKVGARVCISAEFRAFATNASRPVANFVRDLAHDLASRRPGQGVGVIGMCVTGGFALAAAVDESVLASVLSQPSLPLPLTTGQRTDLGVSEEELACIAERTRNDGLCVLGLRFSKDWMAPEQRFAALSARLGDAFKVIPLDSGRGNSGGFGRFAHAVLTHELRESPVHPAFKARADVVAFLRHRLGVTEPRARKP
ncbi:dienelactone hydrolase family protein [Streptomyces sp. NPDC041003]|uniref:dienelactone hydrolase family protein n=1 Tax=Streptomyces sp. NPDC041003 TaxID=3155730 RepID=UPI0033CC1973